MKTVLLLSFLALAGCQIPGVLPEAPAAPEVRVAPAPAVPPESVLERKLRRQAQLVEALLSQNEALQARLKTEDETRPAMAPPAKAESPRLVAMAPAVSGAGGESALAPNADGVIDLTAPVAAGEAEVNPFAVRRLPPESVREVSLHLGGLVAGARPCAVINDRPVEPGGAIEGLTLLRIEAAGVVLQFDGQRLRLPLAEKPVRVRLPL